MNKEQIRKNIGKTRRFRPHPLSRENGAEKKMDDKWLVERVDKSNLALKNTRTNQRFELGTDNIKEYRSPDFLILRCQLIVKKSGIEIEPILAPSEINPFEINVLKSLIEKGWNRTERANWFHVKRLIDEGLIEEITADHNRPCDPRTHFLIQITDKGRIVSEIVGNPKINLPKPTMMPNTISKSIAPQIALDWKSSEFSPVLAVASLVGSWDENNDNDIKILQNLIDIPFNQWQSEIRKILQLENSPLKFKNGIWKVKNREDLWTKIGSCIFDNHLDHFKESAIIVLSEIDPQFDLDPEKRYAANIYGKVLSHSKDLRKGFAETLALLGSRQAPIVNCSREKCDSIAILTTRGILTNASWRLWGSLNDLLPLISEAAPIEFLSSIEKAFSESPSPFQSLFAQEGKGIMGRNYLTGLLWAIEGLAWEEEFLVQTTIILGELANLDPGGQWANRPLNSLTTIFLPWLPQTTASISKRKIAIQTLLKEFPDTAWQLLISLLPDQVNASSHTHKPTWRKIIKSDPETTTTKEYWEQISIYGEIAYEVAKSDFAKLTQLVAHLDHLPKPAFNKVLEYLTSDKILKMNGEKKLVLWNSLTELAAKHRRFADAQWALPNQIIDEIETASKKINPKNPMLVHRRLFSGRDYDLYEGNNNWKDQQERIEGLRFKAIQELLVSGGIDTVIRFSDKVDAPGQVGFTFASLCHDEVDQIIVPTLLTHKNKNRVRFAEGFVDGRFRKKGMKWVDSIINTTWPNRDLGHFLSILPFNSETWHRVDKFLNENELEYWKIVPVNPYQSSGDINYAVDKLIEHGRPFTALNCLAKILHDKKPLDQPRAIKALLSSMKSSETISSNDTYNVIEVIKGLQKNSKTDKDALFKIEWAFLPLLDKHHGSSPLLLESRLASDPAFFCEVIRVIFRSKKELKTENKPSDQEKSLAQNAYQLLHRWRIPPGTTPKGGFSKKSFTNWIHEAVKSCKESGHFEIGLQQIGNVLIYAPSDPSGLWIHKDIATILNNREFEDMRKGFRIAIFNSRGAHSVDPTGKPEIELASKYRQQANEIENAGYQRIAVTLRGIAKDYEREAKRITDEHKVDNDR